MSTIAVNAITDANDGNTTTINGVTPNSANVIGKNKIINGNMMIDQRNAGASVTLTASAPYIVDRWLGLENTDGGMTAQQDTSAPTGFNNSLKFTTTSADSSLAAAQSCRMQQQLEGYNVADLGWGTADAKTVTLSFWVRSSLTGTFAGGLREYNASRGYPFNYTISVANTWEYKTITVTGDTSGTWNTTNSGSLAVIFDLGSGSDYQSTVNTWGAGNYFSTSGATSVIGTSGATFYITGVQLEVGESATEFEHRPYTTELQLCQRYYWRQFFSGFNVIYDRVYWNGAGNNAIFNFPAPSGMRINAATVTCTPTTNGTGTSFTYHPHGNIIVYRASASGDNYLYSQDLAINAEL